MPKSSDESTPLRGAEDEKDGKEGWGSYISQVAIAGTGFLADAYDLFVIDMVLSILHKLHPDGMGHWEKSLVASATVTGAIVGQIVFGFFGDWFGRKITFVVTCFLIIAGAVLSGCVLWTTGGFSLVYQLACCRFLLGIGVGGEYPLAASIAAEGSSSANRGSMVSAVFSMQGWGMLLSCVFVLAFLAVGMPLEYIWRTVLILGALPSALIVYMRSKMEDSELFKQAHEDEVSKGSLTLGSHFQQTMRYIRTFWRPLVGTSMTWLLLDVTFYGTGSFKSRISINLMGSQAATDEGQVRDEALFALVCSCMAIPGYLLSIVFIDKIGRYKLQFWGFLAMATNFFLIALFYNTLSGGYRGFLVFLFGLTFLFSNFGPNTTTFVIPTEVYPTVVRATCHGLSAAAGKVGAVIGTLAFSPCENAFGLQAVLGACGVVCVTGAAFTFFFTDDKVVDLEELDRASRDVRPDSSSKA